MKEKHTQPRAAESGRGRFRHSVADPKVVVITNAAQAHSQEMHGRFVKYAIAMGIRMVCIALVFAFDGWYRLVPVVGAVVLPWVAVIIANGGADISHPEDTALVENAPPFELLGSTEANDDDQGAGDVLTGDFVVPEKSSTNEDISDFGKNEEEHP